MRKQPLQKEKISLNAFLNWGYFFYFCMFNLESNAGPKESKEL